MANNIKIGQIGESVSAQYLLNNGYTVLQRNARYPWGEIDIIARGKDKTLVFVEVKALKMFHPTLIHKCGIHTAGKHNQNSFTPSFTPEENLHSNKLEKVKRTAYLYANANPNLIDEEKGWRIDLLAIEINHQNPECLSLKELLEYSTIRHYENL